MYNFARLRFLLACVLAASILICAAFAQKPFREYPGYEYNDFPIPSDWRVTGEWTFARVGCTPPSTVFTQANIHGRTMPTGGMEERIGRSIIPVRTAIFRLRCAG